MIAGPGGRATIAMLWISRGRPGIVKNDLDFGTNDPIKPRFHLSLLLNVVASATAHPLCPGALRALVGSTEVFDDA